MRRYVLLLVVPLLLMAVSPAAAVQYTIAVSANAGGVVNAPALKGKNLVTDGGSLAVGFTANDGYYLAEVKIDKVAVAPELLTDPKTFTKEFANVTKNYTIAAKFVRDPFITASVTSGGTIDPPGKTYIPYGTDQTFTIQPKTGYHLTKVLVDGVDKGLIESWTFDDVKAKHALKAYFTINTYAVTTEIAATPGTAAPGTITPSMATMKHGQTKVFTIKPAAGLKVAQVTVNDVPQEGLPASGPCKVSVTATGDTKIGVVFSEIVLSGTDKLKGTYNLVFSENSFHVSSNGGNTYVGRNMTGNRAVASFNGAGACSISFTGTSYSRQGDNAGNQTVVVEPESGSMKNCTYVIGSEGNVTITLTTPEGIETLNGWSSPDGNVFIAGGPLQRSDEDGVNYDVDLFTAVKAGSGITKASVAGSYQLVSQDNSFWKSSFNGSTYVNDTIYGNKVRVTFDGIGGCTVVQSGTDFYVGEGNTVISSPENSSTSDCSYSITSAGVMTLKIAETDGVFTVTAWASADGNAFVTGGPSMDTEPDGVGYNVDHNFGVREGSGLSISSLSGTYKLLARNSEFWKPSAGGEVGLGISGDVITATFDGNGGCTVQVEGKNFSAFGNSFNSNTDTHSPAGCTYTLGTNGALTLILNGTEEVTGWVGADTNTLLLGGPQTSGDEEGMGYGSELVVGVKVK